MNGVGLLRAAERYSTVLMPRKWTGNQFNAVAFCWRAAPGNALRPVAGHAESGNIPLVKPRFGSYTDLR